MVNWPGAHMGTGRKVRPPGVRWCRLLDGRLVKVDTLPGVGEKGCTVHHDPGDFTRSDQPGSIGDSHGEGQPATLDAVERRLCSDLAADGHGHQMVELHPFRHAGR